MKQDPLIVETIGILDNGFQTGFTDEKDFKELKANLTVITRHLMDFREHESISEGRKMKLKKGAKIQTAFDTYMLLEQVGSGGNGRVFSAKNEDDELVAIKFIGGDIQTKKLKRFKNEIHFCEHHSHKNIVPVLDRGYVFLDEKDYVFYVMPLYKESLRQKIRDGIKPKDVVKIFIGLLEGLKYAHEHEAVHRDIKPENIMFAENSIEPVICDFGIAHFAEEELITVVKTLPNERMANFYYAAPEQYKSEVVTTPQTDIYSAGLILNEMFTREVPQAAGYKKIADVNADYGYLDDVFEQLYRQNPEDRLYPEDRILLEMKLRAEKDNLVRDKRLVETTLEGMVEPEEFKLSVINKEYMNGNLFFRLDQDIPEKWFSHLISAAYKHTYMVGYAPKNVKRFGKDQIYIRLYENERKDTIVSIVQNVSDWITKTNKIYANDLRRQVFEERRAKEDAIKEELEKREKEIDINGFLAGL